MYDAYNPDVWVRQTFYDSTGGYVVIHRKRLEHSQINDIEKKKFTCELAMSEIFAQNGYRIEMLEEISGVCSYDVNINGIPADLKHVKSLKSVGQSALRAKNQQHAKLVLFQFDKYTPKLVGEIKSLVSKNIHGKYYITKENEIHDF